MKRELSFLSLLLVLFGLFLGASPILAACGDGICEIVSDYENCSLEQIKFDCRIGNLCDEPNCDGSRPADICCTPTTTCPSGWGTWDYAYDSRCVVDGIDDSGVDCDWEWRYQDCSAADRCESSSNVAYACDGDPSGSNDTGKILAGWCSTSCSTGCANGGWYKTCCQVSDVVQSGAQLTGNRTSCTNGGGCSSGARVWGTSCDGCLGSVDAYGTWTVVPCGGVPTTAPTSAPGDPTSTPLPTPSNSFCEVDGQVATVECCDAWLELNVPREATIGDEVYIDIYQHPAWSNTSCVYNELGNDGNAYPHENTLIAYGGEGAADYFAEWDWICGFENDSGCDRDDYGSPNAIHSLNKYSSGDILFQRYPNPYPVATYRPHWVHTSDPIGHDWHETKVWQIRINWDTTGFPAGTYHFDNSGPYTNLQLGAHDNNCPWSACCQNLKSGFGGGYSREGVMHQILGGEVTDDGRIIGNIIYPNRMIRLNDPEACQDTAPSPPSLLQPPDKAQIRSNEVSLVWDHDGAWGTNCAGNSNSFEVRMTRLGLADSCPASFADLGDYYSQANIDSTQQGVSLPKLEYQSRYCWAVRATNGSLSADSGVWFFDVLNPVGWFQGQSGNVYGHNGVSSLVSNSVSDWARYFSLDSGNFGSSGLIASLPGTTKEFGDALAATKSNPDNDDWLVEADLSRLANRYTYDYFASLLDLNQANEEVVWVEDGEGGAVVEAINANPDKQIFVYQEPGGDGTLSFTSPASFLGRKVMVLFDGDVDVNLEDGQQLAPADFFALIASGSINFVGNTGDTSGVYLGTASALGVFIAGDQISTSVSANRFIGRGIFFARNGFSLGRDLGSGNETLSAEFFRFDPKYLFTAPRVLRESPQFWQEVAP